MFRKTLRILSFLFFVIAATAHTDYNPRKLTVSEVKSNPSELKLDNLLSSKTTEVKQLPPSEAAVPLSHLPKGTNLEAGPKDAIRYVKHASCTMQYSTGNERSCEACIMHHAVQHRQWKIMFLECPGQTGVARGGVRTVPSPWEDMPGQTGWWLVVTLLTYNATLVQVLQASWPGLSHQYRARSDQVRPDQCEDTHGHALLLWWEVPLLPQDGQNSGGWHCGQPLLQCGWHPLLCILKSKGNIQTESSVLAKLLFHQVCSARNWWGRCTSQQEKHEAVWRKPLPYFN